MSNKIENLPPEPLEDLLVMRLLEEVELSYLCEMAAAAGVTEEDMKPFIQSVVDVRETIFVKNEFCEERVVSAFPEIIKATNMSYADSDRLGSTLIALQARIPYEICEFPNYMAPQVSELLATTLEILEPCSQMGLTGPQVMAVAASLNVAGMAYHDNAPTFADILRGAVNGAIKVNNDQIATLAKVLEKSEINGQSLIKSAELLPELVELAQKAYDENTAINKVHEERDPRQEQVYQDLQKEAITMVNKYLSID